MSDQKRSKVEQAFPFSEPLTPQEAKTLLAHLPRRNAGIGSAVRHDENPVLYLAIWKLEWTRDRTP